MSYQEKTMSTNVLESVQAAIDERGVQDVKFLFQRRALSLPLSDLAEDVAGLLSAFENGEKDVLDELPSEGLSE